MTSWSLAMLQTALRTNGAALAEKIAGRAIVWAAQ